MCRNNAKKVLSVLLMLAVFCVSFVPCVYAAAKSTYTSTLSFDTTCIGSPRHYNGVNIASKRVVMKNY